jgi:hypothetical protein
MNWRFIGLLSAVLAASVFSGCGSGSSPVTLEVLNPRGEIPPPPVMGIQPRLNDLAGKRIALCENGKMGADLFFDAVEELLQQRYPTATILRTPKPQGSRFAFVAEEWYEELSRKSDAFIFGMGD